MEYPSISEFLSQPYLLTRDEQQVIVEQSILVLEDHFVHAPLKQTIDGLEPVQALRLLRKKLAWERFSHGTLAFHRRLLSIFTALRDQHTAYLLPEPFRSHVATLPFEVGWFQGGSPVKVVRYCTL